MEDTPAALAQSLRQLRLERGAPTYERLARSAHLSRSTVVDALAGSRPPSDRTLYAIVSALGEDPGPWLARRAELLRVGESEAAEPSSGAEASPDAGDAPAGGDAPSELASPIPEDPEGELAEPIDPIARPQRAVGVGMAAGIAAAALVVGAVGGGAAVRQWWPGAGASAEAEPATGDDIFSTGCVHDGIVISTDQREFDAQFSVHLSYECDAVWARVYRYDGNAFGNKIKVVLSPKSPQSPGPAQEVEVEDSSVAITPMIVQNAVTDEFCAEAWVTNGSEEWVSLGDPMCV